VILYSPAKSCIIIVKMGDMSRDTSGVAFVGCPAEGEDSRGRNEKRIVY
jgi:hypothetical protein